MFASALVLLRGGGLQKTTEEPLRNQWGTTVHGGRADRIYHEVIKA